MGIGRAIATTLAKEGVRLAVMARRRNLLEELEKEIGAKLVLIECDFLKENAAQAVAQGALAGLGSVDILVNNAGGSRRFTLESTDAQWEEALTLNFVRQRQLAHALLPQMIERKWGRIINISGISPYTGGGATKAMVKLGIVGFTRGLAREFAPHNITANCIGPGTIGRAEKDDHEGEKVVKASQPIRRKGRPEEVTALMLHLASENAGFTTGQCYLVNGGMYFQ